jgi:hypothetical protein
LGKIFGFMHAQRVKNDCGAQVLFFSQVWINHLFWLRGNKNFWFHARAQSQKWLWRASIVFFPP